MNHYTNEDLIKIYTGYKNESLSKFFDDLINFVYKNSTQFNKYVYKNSQASVMKFKASDFYLGTTEDNIELAINIYIKNIPNFTEREICKHVMSLIWDIATFMTDEICPSCQDSNLKISSSIDTKQIYKTCDNCLVTIYHNSFIERPEEMVPATRKKAFRIRCSKHGSAILGWAISILVI